MIFTDFNSLFLSAKHRLPYLEADDTKSFLFRFRKRMEEYVQDLQNIDEIVYEAFDKSIILDQIKWLTHSLEDVLRVYLDGYPSKAYEHFRNIAESNILFQDLNYSRLVKIDSDSPFFRSKKAHGLKLSLSGAINGFQGLLAERDMFHVPFEKRRAIGTNRYSIPGFPCMYLSDHLKTSWSECMDNDTQPFHAICYRNHRPLYLVDLVPLNVLMEQNHGKVPHGLFHTKDEIQVLINYALVYPIICACHSKITYKEDYAGEEIKFKSEYIIPQLLMLWYREKGLMIDGIRYLSCTAEAKFPGVTINKHNYVIPVEECLEIGYCPSLLINFSATPVYSYSSATGKGVDLLLNEIQDALLVSTTTAL